MNKPLLIENARIVDPATNADFHGSVLIQDGNIADIAEGEPLGAPEKVDRIDAKGMVLAPGLIDIRVFTGEPGHEHRETLKSAGQAAAAGGVTSIVVMPDTQPVIDDGALVEFIARHAQAMSGVNVLPSAAITKGTQGKDLTEFGLLREAGAVCFTDGRNSLQSASVMRSAMVYATNFDVPIVHLPGEASLIADGVMNAGPLATFRGLKGIPAEAETIPLDRDLQLALATGARYHAAAISTARSAELAAFYKKQSGSISVGISINNLCLNENDIGSYRTFFKLNPPLRTEDDRLALVEALKTGVIDVIVSDHDPQDSEGKRQPFADAATGAIGLETLLAAALRLVHSGDVDLMTVLRAVTIRPAEILGLNAGRIAKGAKADLCLFDPDYPWIVEEARIRSRSTNTTFENARMTGKVMATLVGGNIVYREEAFA
ncbi:dihydroorotase [Pelagibacterium sp. 26DY04]|uniref:dihydroorotase n=1 Tax=Pelagibacterium sp. 26DY04 TaxID=2967130 RepID=UPI0028160B92|nr:dihydroorotase [Pelagibacterium sp. 26DY04]WMT85350.1 dihydroorotase [Pelagibacterium sp. 26DY04]